MYFLTKNFIKKIWSKGLYIRLKKKSSLGSFSVFFTCVLCESVWFESWSADTLDTCRIINSIKWKITLKTTYATPPCWSFLRWGNKDSVRKWKKISSIWILLFQCPIVRNIKLKHRSCSGRPQKADADNLQLHCVDNWIGHLRSSLNRLRVEIGRSIFCNHLYVPRITSNAGHWVPCNLKKSSLAYRLNIYI